MWINDYVYDLFDWVFGYGFIVSLNIGLINDYI